MPLTCLHLYLNRYLRDGLYQPKKIIKKKYTYKVIYRGKYTVRCCDNMAQYNILSASKLGTPKFMDARHHIKRRINSREAYNAFLADLQANDTTDSPNEDPDCDLNQNYNTFHDHHFKLEKHLINIDTRATSISHGVLRLIKYRDKLYQDNKYATCIFVFRLWYKTCFTQQIAKKDHKRSKMLLSQHQENLLHEK